MNTYLPLNLAGVPAVLRAQPWIAWRVSPPDAGGKVKKLPYQIGFPSELASSSEADEAGRCDPGTPQAGPRNAGPEIRHWRNEGDVAEVLALAPDLFTGFGIVLTAGAGITFIDLDHVRDPETGAIDEWAMRLVELMNSWSEQRVVRTHAHLVDGLIPAAGTVALTGEDKVGKSTLAGLLTLSYIHAAPFLGRAIPRPGRAIIVSEEDDADELRDRFRALHQGLARAYPDLVGPPDDPASLALVADRLVWEARAGLHLDDSRGVADLVAQIHDLIAREPDGPPVLVSIDSLQAVRGLADPTKPEGVALVKAALRQLNAAGAVNLLVAHARKVVSGGKRTSRASQEIAANHELAADIAATIGLIAVGPRADAPVRVDLFTKRGKSGVFGYLQITYTPEAWPPDMIAVTVNDAPQRDPRVAASDAKVIDAIVALPAEAAEEGTAGVSSSAIVARTKLGKRTVERVLTRLQAAKSVHVIGTMANQAKLYARTPNDGA